MDKNQYPDTNQAYPPPNCKCAPKLHFFCHFTIYIVKVKYNTAFSLDGGQPQGAPYPSQPQGGMPPPAYGGAPGRPVVVAAPRMYGPDPVTMPCPNCHSEIQTRVTSDYGAGAWLAGIAIACMG